MRAAAVGAVAAAVLASTLTAQAPGPAAPGLGPSTPAAAAAAGPVRVHVIARSDGPADQAAKQRAAWAVAAELERLQRAAPPQARADGARYLAYLRAHGPLLQRAAEQAAGGGPVRVAAGLAFYPVTVDDGGRLYPAGWYLSLRVLLGAARGHNWWCVVFPSLCPAPPPADDRSRARAAPAQAPPGGEQGADRSAAAPGAPAPTLTPQEPDGGARPAAAPAGQTPSVRPWWLRWLPWNWW